MAMSTARRSTRSGERAASTETARERILFTAYDLFARNGIRAVGVDRIVAESGVAKTTLYRHCASKDDLVVAALALREDLWSRDWLQYEVGLRGCSRSSTSSASGSGRTTTKAVSFCGPCSSWATARPHPRPRASTRWRGS